VPSPGGSGNNNDDNDNAQTGAPAPVDTSVAQTTAATSTLTASVQVVTLNVRQGPGTTFPVIGRLTQGSTVTVEGRNQEGDWWLVCCIPGGSTRGWISAALITPNFAAEQAASLPIADAAAANTGAATGGQQGTVAGVTLNVRSGPSTGDVVLGKLRGNDTVSVIGRNANGDWLFVCCTGTPQVSGWVSAQFITPAFAAADLPELGPDGQPAGSTGVIATGPVTPTETTTATATGDAAAPLLSVSVAQQPPFAVQGKEIALVYTVANDGATDLAEVVLTSELPGPLTLVGASAGSEGVVAQEEGTPVVTVTWASVPAGESVTATVRVRVAEDVPNGTTFANLATVTTGSGDTAASGITIGMPPSLLPEFW
jgi:uncharacterized protein YgiM (DUF1202 family)